jgi:hypothetical protein
MLLYLRVSADFPLTYYRIRPNGLFDGAYIFYGNISNPNNYSRLDNQHVMVPGATIGLELHFLNWMSTALNFEMRFGDAMAYAFIPGFGLELKFPIKPARHFMLEPYISGSFSMNTGSHSVSFPDFSAGGGLQLGVKGGDRGVWFFDANFMHSLGDIRTRNIVNNEFPNPEVLHWKRFVAGLSIGYKFGFINK